MKLGEISRLITIQKTLIRYGLDEIVLASSGSRPVRILFYLFPWNWFGRKRGPRAERLRCALEDLGPIFIKLGQILSTRRDFLPEDISQEFSKLQDKVPPFPGKEARRIIEDAFEKKIDEIFLEFDETPLASASIAQVHAAKMKDGREMIIKVVRPDVEEIIRRDLGLMYFLADKVERYTEDGRRLGPVNVIAEFEKTLLGELDLMREAANASQLRRNFADSDKLYVPEVCWDLTHKNVMVMERISGIAVNDIESLKAAGVDLKWLAEAGIEIFFTEVLRDSFFHADMHPGNIFVSRPEPGKPAKIMLVDFGIMSSLSEFDQRYLAENFMAFLDRDYQRVAELHVESGWVPAGTRIDEFEFAIRTVCEPLFDRSLTEISFGTMLLRLFQTARQFGMVIIPQLLLLQKTLVNIEGLGRQLYPELDIWKTARPLFEYWMHDRIGVRGLAKGLKQNLPRWLDRLPDLPNKTIDIIERLRDGKIQVELKAPELEKIRTEIRQSNKRSVLATVGSAFIICAAVIFGLDGYSPAMVGGVPYLTWLFGGVGLLLLLFSMSE
ncbi:MAG: ubiquinone biosynthesis regulatory protein kinase UbiB [Gammaproteobacteria bacterium]|nr:MAG: ubiquinone biosynthesis regulatory protein kinase UbiB [Gammaproteobacteria bacterium]